MPDYRDREAIEEFLAGLKQGDRIQITADRAIATGDEGTSTGMWDRGEQILADSAEVVGVDREHPVVRLDEQSVTTEANSNKHRATEFRLNGLQVVAQWERVDGSDAVGDWELVDMPVALLTRISHE